MNASLKMMIKIFLIQCVLTLLIVFAFTTSSKGQKASVEDHQKKQYILAIK